METVTIKKVYRDVKTTKYGDKTMTTIYVAEYPDVRMSSFDKGLDGLKEGDKLSVEITKNGEFTNFKTGTKTSDIESRLKKLEEAVFNKQNTGASTSNEDF